MKTNSNDQTFDGLPPLDFDEPRRPTKRDELIDNIVDYFDRASRSDQVAYNFSCGLAALHSEACHRYAMQLPLRDRDRLMWALLSARSAVMALFPGERDAHTAKAGLDGTSALILHWSEPRNIRDARHHHVFMDICALSRWLRNALHNLCILEDFATRQRDRTSDAVAEILRSAAA